MINLVLDLGSYALTPHAIPTLLAAILLQILGVSVVILERGERTSLFFLLMTTALSSWLTMIGLVYFSTDVTVASFWSHAVFFGVCFIPTVLFHFTNQVVDLVNENKVFIRLGWGISSLFALAVLATDGMVQGVYRYWWGFYPDYGPLGFAYLLFFGWFLIWNVWLIVTKMKDVPDESMRQKRYVTFLVGWLVAYPASVDFLPAYGISVYPVGFLFVFAFCTIIAWGISRYRLLDFSPAYAADTILSTMVDPLFICNLDGRIKLVNDAFCEVLDFEKDDILNNSVETLIHDSDRQDPAGRLLEDDHENRELEYVFQSSDGDAIDVQLSVSPLTDSDENKIGSVIIARDIRERKEAQKEALEIAYHHSITELPNRRFLFNEYADREFQTNLNMNVLMMELSDFQEIKNALGPKGVEVLLEQLADRFEDVQFPHSELFHWSENEFILVNQSETEVLGIKEVAERWLRTLEDPFRIQGRSHRLHGSVGISMKPDHANDLEELINKANLAKDVARGDERSDVVVYRHELQQRIDQRVSLKNDLREAIEENRLEVHYQPIITERTLFPSKFEALLRWDHPEEGFVPPPKIVELAEDLNLMDRLGNWILKTSTSQVREWNQRFGTDFDVSVNISSMRLQDQNLLLESVTGALADSGLPANQLELEITETAAVRNIERSIGLLEQLRSNGLRVSVDDFGTGYSTMQYLIDLPLDTLKIDKSFVLNLFGEKDNRILVETILNMSDQLGIDVVAEGVETFNHFDFLAERGCEYYQGYLWTKPRSPDGIVRLLKQYLNGEEPAKVRDSGRKPPEMSD
ncbi:MAG: EAL domain-containing protein [bacterium]